MKKIILVGLVGLVFAGCGGVNLREDIVVSSPMFGAEVSSPLAIEGLAKGKWFFEGSFPVELVDGEANVLAEGYVTAQEDWMSEDFVPFKGSLEFETESERGTLIFKNDNPSGLPENEMSFEVSVKFGVNEKKLVEDYIRENIGALNPIEPVLGGSWYVLSVEFTDDGVEVMAEDGHIESSFTAEYSVSEDGEVQILNVVATE